jgi:hypothetical protein
MASTLAEFSNRIPFFLDSFLNSPGTQIPRQGQWVLTFDDIPQAAIKKTIRYEPGNTWLIETAMAEALNENYVKSKGCLFAQAVEIPGEATAINPEGIQTNGFIRSTVGAGREVFEQLKIVFLETNTSFVDNVIRPWVIATSHLGLIARSGDDNYRTNATVFKLGNTSSGPVLLQKYNFFGVCPINVSGMEFNYSPSNSPINRNVTFLYHYYTSEGSVITQTTSLTS